MDNKKLDARYYFCLSTFVKADKKGQPEFTQITYICHHRIVYVNILFYVHVRVYITGDTR